MALTRLTLDSRAVDHPVVPYEELNGEAEFGLDPGHELNRFIADLELAQRGTDGRVHVTADMRIIRPQRPTGRGLFLDVPNRGNSVFERMTERGPMTGA